MQKSRQEQSRFLWQKIFCIFLLLIGLINFNMYSQLEDCSLDIGGQETEVLIGVFQLNEEQQSYLETWRGELSVQARTIEDQISQLLASHPQSTEADLFNLSKKYAQLKDQLVAITLEYDQKMLGTFNPKQYEFYRELCKEALRRPLVPVPLEEEEEEEPE